MTLAIGTNPERGTLSGTLTSAAVAGVATFAGISINKPGTGYTLKATFRCSDGSNEQRVQCGRGTSVATGVHGAAHEYQMRAQPITPSVQVSVEDAGGNIVTTATSAVTVAIGTNPGSGTLAGTLTQPQWPE